MEAIFIYIAKSSSLMLLFYCTYYFLLRKETFFNSNRWFLLFGLIISTILPLISYTKVVWINATQSLNGIVQSPLPEIVEKETLDLNWSYILFGLYAFGFIVFIVKFAIDFYSLNTIIKGKKIKQQADFKFIDINENIAPFSYFEYIVYNSSLYTSSELENIIEHEKVHSDQNHTVDVLVSRAFSIIFWFNPLVWLYKKAITQNLEFIADSEAAKKLLDKKAYQYTLLKITTHENCVAITNHFYQSLIKKRIVMLNKNQSKKRNSWKYYVVIPALAAFVLLFQVEVIAKEKPQIIKENDSNIESMDVYKIRKNSTDTELNEIKNNLQKYHKVKFEFSEVKRNDSNQLTAITVDVKRGKQRAKSVQNSDNKAINEFGVIIITYKNGDKKIGIQTVNESQNKEPKTGISNKLKTKTETNVNTDFNTSTKTNNTTNTNVSTVVTTNTDNNVTTITTSEDGPKIVISNSSKIKINDEKLIIVDGTVMPAHFDLNDLKSSDIKTMSVYKGVDAIAKYGDEGKNGVIVIETRK
ncbi:MULTISPECIES: M56 family metallopeptidase [Flavobacterium]|uniref:M56 family metallopeptidase n=1 Tax=Flavobacterium TaxID=237 RepID=UPI0011838888|nr:MULTISPECIES: M56 family metallopeptidase [Flavobacterium]MCR4029237.1 M56 family metallopeptidase [Flavobacterium panacis]